MSALTWIRGRRPLRPALAVAAVALLAACGSGSSGGTTSTSGGSPGPAVSKDATAAGLLPSSVSSKGTLTVGTDASYAPSEFIDTDGKTVVGFDVDLAKAIGQVLGLKVTLQNAPFDTIIEGVKSGKYDLGISSFTINPDRDEAGRHGELLQRRHAWAVPAGNPRKITPDNACGKKVAVQKDTVQVDDITARSKKCTDGGQAGDHHRAVHRCRATPPSAVVTGKDDGELADSPVIAYAVKQTGGKLEQVGDIYDSAPYGIVVPKDSGRLARKARPGRGPEAHRQRRLRSRSCRSGASRPAP